MQINKYKIVYSKIYEKWQVKRRNFNHWTILEEFSNEEDAIKWAKDN